mmetsp:Transcript_5896/g.9062  ORF Transcript_5896/g.9062 Transcript_5896/m.9062 type:complete len:342 (+) Transcript_5896:133-1158(+)|eukprot:CAMPEP_0184658694 /NCGR_PEP_ID=MMETSP0308-20130426/26519_1 /TAXON_ID=38269 /ORGANISM="Gloeochaete witrockiana, Strain SAG 46.84" /LENGTH=341 /DNA_ID=CAMNT_0027097875 /DNA_START=60 /DNA_END=1085 /DNA_ORIENTATION=-
MDAETRSKLGEWFRLYALDPTMEIEARFHDVDKEQFDRMMKMLMKNPSWSNKPAWDQSEDWSFDGRIRRTILSNGSQVVVQKEQFDRFDVGAIRFSVAQEFPMESTWKPGGPARIVRKKKRMSFVHKNLFAFELTLVQQGQTREEAQRAPVKYEVELEFKGQSSHSQKNFPANYLVDSFLMKIKDLNDCLSNITIPSSHHPHPHPHHPPPPTSSSSKRPHSDIVGDVSSGGHHPNNKNLKMGSTGSLSETKPLRKPAGPQEGQVVMTNSPVQLDVGKGDFPPDGVMEEEISSQLEWELSHINKSDETAYIMNMPSDLPNGVAYHLFKYCGFVPYSSLTVRR